MLTACAGGRGVVGVLGVGINILAGVGVTVPLSGGGTGIGIAAACSEGLASGLSVGNVDSDPVAVAGTGIRIERREVTAWVGKVEAVAAVGKGAGTGDRDLACLTTTVASGISPELDGIGASAAAGWEKLLSRTTCMERGTELETVGCPAFPGTGKEAAVMLLAGTIVVLAGTGVSADREG
jgi:hypothetical protein